jgi:aspartate/methionine/tyrosine aminotransferase
LSDRLARAALVPERRLALLERTRGILRANLPILETWLQAHQDTFTWLPPEAGAIGYVRYRHRINSTVLVTRLREDKSVLIVPGDHFGMDHYLRIGFGEPPASITAGLGRLHDLLASLAEPERMAAPGT